MGSSTHLIDVHIDIPIESNRRAIWPDDARVSEEAVRLAIAIRCRVVVIDGVVRGHELVDEAIGVALEAIGVATTLAVAADVAVGVELSGRV